MSHSEMKNYAFIEYNKYTVNTKDYASYKATLALKDFKETLSA